MNEPCTFFSAQTGSFRQGAWFKGPVKVDVVALGDQALAADVVAQVRSNLESHGGVGEGKVVIRWRPNWSITPVPSFTGLRLMSGSTFQKLRWLGDIVYQEADIAKSLVAVLCHRFAAWSKIFGLEIGGRRHVPHAEEEFSGLCQPPAPKSLTGTAHC